MLNANINFINAFNQIPEDEKIEFLNKCTPDEIEVLIVDGFYKFSLDSNGNINGYKCQIID